MGKSVLIVVNSAKPEAAAAAPEIRAQIEKHGRVVAVLTEEDHGDEHHRGADLVVTLGGDGTMLAQARRCADLGIPLLGVNFGKLGFIAEFNQASLAQQAEALFGDAEPDCRVLGLVHAAVHRDGAPEPEVRALGLNECVITAGPPYRMIELSMTIDGDAGPTLRGDGIIICSPVGSTAYNLSAGGPILSPQVDALAITPIAPHSLAFRPIVVPGASRIELTLLRVNEERPGTSLLVDGGSVVPLKRGDRVAIFRHDKPVRFVRNPRANFWSTLAHKLHWAAPPRLR